MTDPNQHCLSPLGRYALPSSICKKAKMDGAKTLINIICQWEGKTFCSINRDRPFLHLAKKKTVIIGCDLRKPKLFDEFNLSNVGSSTI
jgi:hypothetical protein